MLSPTPIADKYRVVSKKILTAALADRMAYKRLEYLTDRIGHRLSGSKALERAVAWAAKTMKADGHDNVHTERVMVPHWVRGKESAELVAPNRRSLSILGLGGTIGTPRRGITAEVVVVDNFKQLQALGADKVKGKTVLFNAKMPAFHPEKGSGYSKTVAYRWAGARVAAQYGAVAALVRSVTANSLRTPHTGSMGYKDGVKKIPTAAVSTEDADLMARLVASGQTVKVRLKLGARMRPDKPSANVIAELRGTDKPDEIVVIGAHLDSWDVGQGAHDDGTGCVIMMHAIGVLKKLGLRPKRTIRVVLFTNEENGGRGSKDYATRHAAAVSKHVLAIESDGGGFAPRGFNVDGTPAAIAMVKDIVSLLEPIGATRARKGYGGADIAPLAKLGVPALGLWVDGSRYFDYHHTHADTFDKVDAKDLAKGVAAVAVFAYVVADMDGVLPRKPVGAPSPPAVPAAKKSK
jgi:carboxypeptidase Q